MTGAKSCLIQTNSVFGLLILKLFKSSEKLKEWYMEHLYIHNSPIQQSNNSPIIYVSLHLAFLHSLYTQVSVFFPWTIWKL